MAPSLTDRPRSTGGKHQFDEANHFHIGWDWHAGMWYVEPPADYDEGDTKYFWDRGEAFNEVDDLIREQPVERSGALQDLLPDADLTIEYHRWPADENLPTYIPGSEPVRTQIPEPVRKLSATEARRAGADERHTRYGVLNPIAEQSLESREARIAEYQDHVGGAGL